MVIEVVDREGMQDGVIFGQFGVSFVTFVEAKWVQNDVWEELSEIIRRRKEIFVRRSGF